MLESAQVPTGGKVPGNSGLSEQRPWSAQVLVIAVWFALVAGLLEALIGWAVTLSGSGLVDRSPLFLWMVPFINVLFFAAVAVMLWLAGKFWPTLTTPRVAAFVFGVPSFYALLLMVPRVHWAAALVLAMGLAVQATRVVTLRQRGFISLVHRSIWPLIAVLVVLAIGMAGRVRWTEVRTLAKLPAANRNAPNVLVIILDTVRSASLSLYGYTRPTTPELERLARNGTVFNRAISTAPWTLPSHASVFTGRFPHELGVDWRTPLDTTYPTLAEVLQAHGYTTSGFVANTGYTNKSTGLGRGFAHYEDFRITLGEMVRSSGLGKFVADNFRVRQLVRNDEHLNRQSAEVINRKFLGWLDRRGDRPFFTFLNYYDAHGPYLPKAPYDRRFGPGRANGKLSPLHRWNWNPSVAHRDLTQAEQREEIDAYDGAIAYLDQQIGVLFDELRERGLLDNTIVIVTSDHGEEFGEHGVYDHGNSLYLASVHVPLLISFPAGVPGGQRVEPAVSLRDIPATVMSLAGIAAPAGFPGLTLARFWSRSDAAAPATPIVSEVTHATGHPDWFPVSKGNMAAIIEGPLRYIRGGDGAEELYDIFGDPWERRDLADAPTQVQTLLRFRAAGARLSGAGNVPGTAPDAR